MFRAARAVYSSQSHKSFSLIGTGINESFRTTSEIHFPPLAYNYSLPLVAGFGVAIVSNVFGGPVETVCDSAVKPLMPYRGTDFVITKCWGTASK